MKFFNDKRGVFGLTAVQQFFAIILSLALLAYVIIVIMGTLQTSDVIPASSLAGVVINETGAHLNTSANSYTLALATTPGFASPAITAIWANESTAYAVLVPAANYTVSALGVLTVATSKLNVSDVSVSYTYKYNSNYANSANGILGNVSAGVTGFFSSINPVYAILAILVIILILVVLVRVVAPDKSAPEVGL
jgi:hypothetical protein